MGYHLHQEKEEDDDSAVVWVYEDPALVLLGGEVWPASFIVCEHICSFLRAAPTPASLAIVELGAGTGLCGLVALAAAVKRLAGSVHCFLTDESPALSEVNLSYFAFPGAASSFPPPSSFSAHALELSWGGDANTLPSDLTKACQSSGQVLILGVEVTPMLQTQAALVETVFAVLTISSFPAVPSPSSSSSAPSICKTASSAATSFPKTPAVAILTIDACVSGKIYPSTCPHPKPCAGHRFLKLVEERAGMMWEVKEIWNASEVREACRRRRVVADGSGRKDDETESCSRDFAVTAPEGLVIVHVWLEAA